MNDDELRQRIARGVRAVRAEEHGRAAAVVVTLVPSEGEHIKRELGEGEHIERELGEGEHIERELGDFNVLLEVRASSLEQQPGEVCCPGGHVEPSETPAEAAVRETCEELCVSPAQVTLLGSLGVVAGPGDLPLYAFVARLSGYRGTFSADEVASVFTIPASWLLDHEPRTYRVRYDPVPPEDFPWERVEGGRAYRWRPKYEGVPFYLGAPAHGASGGSPWSCGSVTSGGSPGSCGSTAPSEPSGLDEPPADGFPVDCSFPLDREPLVWGATARVLQLFSRVMSITS